MSFEARFADVTQLIVSLHNVSPERLTALRGRLQHLQKLNFPPGINTGRGRPAEYGARQILLLVLALELIVLGAAPERAAAVMRDQEDRVRAAVRKALEDIGNETADSERTVFLRLEPVALFDRDPNLGFGALPEIAQFLRKTALLDGFWRHALVNLSGLIDYAAKWAANVGEEGGRVFCSDLEEWSRTPSEKRHVN